MIKIDLITGFLGSGKTTFIKKYAKYLLDKGNRIGILENDFGAVNIDRMLLQELQSEQCDIETVAGACDRDCHKRRFKTKLIAMGMLGYDRVIIEPSGIFDIDEFFDSLHEEPLDRWYETGNVIAIVDAQLDEHLSDSSEYLLASQTANAGAVVLSRVQYASDEERSAVIAHLNRSLQTFGCQRIIDSDIVSKNWENFDESDYEKLLSCGCRKESFVKRFSDDNGYQSLYVMHCQITPDRLCEKAKQLLDSKEHGNIFRVKGFVLDGGKWFEINAAHKSIDIHPIPNGQEIIIVIGEHLNQEKISAVFEKS